MPSINVVPEGTKGAITFYGGARELLATPNWDGKNHQMFLAGPAETGKTLAACMKMHLLCQKYPGIEILMCRLSATALRQTAVKTYQRMIANDGWSKVIRILGQSKPEQFIYPHVERKDDRNGREYSGQSRIIIGSLERSSDVLGAEYDFIYVNQPEEIGEEDWEYLASRCTGRRGVAPYTQMWGDPNPAHEQHWIKRGSEEGKWKLLKSFHKDNPRLWDMEKQDWTEAGKTSMSILSNFGGVRLARLYRGEWASVEGLVYADVWNPRRHVMSRTEFETLHGQIDSSWKRYLTIDFGFRVFVCMEFREHPRSGVMVNTKTYFHSERNIGEHAEKIKDFFLRGEDKPDLVIADRDPNLISFLQEQLGLNIIAADKRSGSIKAGIELLTDQLKSDKLIFLDDTIVERDDALVAKKKPIGFIEEVGNYRWDEKKEIPIKEDDHALDTCRYLITHLKSSNRKVKVIWV